MSLYAVVDIETTGGNALTDRITEVAVFLTDGVNILDSFTSLVNPERRISPFISELTGITNDMVTNAPKFYEVAKKIVEISQDAIFVAHNVQFDYSFLRQEFLSLGFPFKRQTLCTVQLSRQVVPGYRSYSLGNICQSLGIDLQNRHRAAGDALATTHLLHLLISKDEDLNLVQMTNSQRPKNIPPHLDPEILDLIPESPGVYYFHNRAGDLLYVGMSINIYKRVLSHFSGIKSRRALEMFNEIASISWELCGNELVSKLLESEEIKSLQPQFNRAQRRTYFSFGIFNYQDEKGYLRFNTGRINKGSEPLLACTSAEEAKIILEKRVEKFSLCQRLAGLYQSPGPCFYRQIKKCSGACSGEESPETYNERAQQALASMVYPERNLLIIGQGRNADEKSAVLIRDGKYRGFGFYSREGQLDEIELALSSIKHRDDNRDVQQIIRTYLRSNPKTQIIRLSTERSENAY